MLQQYGISPDIFDGHVSTEEAEQSIMEAEVPKQMQIVAIEGADLPDVFKNLLLENNNSEVYQKLGVTTFAEYVSKYFAKLVIEIVAFLVTFLFATIVIRAVVFDSTSGSGNSEQAGRSSGRVDDFIYYSRDPVYRNYASIYNNDRKAGNGNDQRRSDP